MKEAMHRLREAGARRGLCLRRGRVEKNVQLPETFWHATREIYREGTRVLETGNAASTCEKRSQRKRGGCHFGGESKTVKI